MHSERENTPVTDLQQEKMLKIITKGFYKELVNYGVEKKDIIRISSHLLDCLMHDTAACKSGDEYYNNLFSIKDIHDAWQARQRLDLKSIGIACIEPGDYAQIASWLKNPSIKYHFISSFPETEQELKRYFKHPDRRYFRILYADEPVGVIGADNIDSESKKLEMKKFVGNTHMQGKGLGKLATFLFLYYAFRIMDFDKVYIHSRDTNIRNINLNSKFGFELEGIFFNEVTLHNEKHDVVRMGLLKSRWLEIFS